ncbi:MAG TPA: right-handed parallel beta-helix repeat-containing protein [Myxococcota bacterium]|nr:right-handed parallel beta-helix repeat-containing protein [Myxococcota bacterium]
MRVASLIGVWLAGASQVALGATLFSASQGVDAPSCGPAKSPCRSISQAIANAAAGDTIIVGPGYYGDLDGDGVFGETGEETAEIGSGCDCVVKIDKRLGVRSRDGATATVIDAAGLVISAVSILGSGAASASLGGANAGFTLRGGQGAGVIVDAAASGVGLAGNVALRNAGDGFIVAGVAARVTGNRALENDGSGFQFAGDGVMASGNAASANGGDGFFCFALGGSVQKSVASGNVGYGFEAIFADFEFHSVAALGNGIGGVFFDASSGSLTASSLIGNGRGGGVNCGVVNDTGGAIVATGNYWGAATGPGADPADDACDGTSATTTTAPFVKTEIKIRPKPLR